MIMTQDQIIEEAKLDLQVAAEAIQAVQNRISNSFSKLVKMILGCKGKVVISGIGKSGIICRKISATLSSTGTPSLFLHPAEAIQGDLGILDRKDLLIAISNSGESVELLNMIFAAKNLGIHVASLTGNEDSTLAKHTDPHIDFSAPREACPLGLAPTTSTTVALALGDALAIVVMKMKGFKREDYAALHPGGNLGQRLKLKVRDIMIMDDDLPIVSDTANLVDALAEMTNKNNLGISFVTDDLDRLVGIITDGDIRRIVQRFKKDLDPNVLKVTEIMTSNPKIIDAHETVSNAVQMMESSGITSLAIINSESKPIGLLHLHDVFGRGNFII